jgi:hypothetical protein
MLELNTRPTLPLDLLGDLKPEEVYMSMGEPMLYRTYGPQGTPFLMYLSDYVGELQQWFAVAMPFQLSEAYSEGNLATHDVLCSGASFYVVQLHEPTQLVHGIWLCNPFQIPESYFPEPGYSWKGTL